VIERIPVERRLTPDEASALVGTRAPELAPTHTGPAVFVDSKLGHPIAAYLPLRDAAPLRREVLTVDTSSGVQRQNNYRSKSRTFGYAPRRPVTRRESCALTLLGVENPDVERLLESYADQFSRALLEIDPEIIPRDTATLGEVLPDWRIGGEKLWTSGVINDTAALPYHRDGFNFPTWSAMPVLRRGVRGGHLSIPEYGLVLPCMDSTVVYFPGKLYVHGVTPMTKATPDGYRFSIVYYALQGMKNCREAAEEAAYGRRRRTEREAEMASRLAAGDRTIPSGGQRGKETGQTTEAVARLHGSLANAGFDPEEGVTR
jgi:hypothetical protein